MREPRIVLIFLFVNIASLGQCQVTGSSIPDEPCDEERDLPSLPAAQERLTAIRNRTKEANKSNSTYKPPVTEYIKPRAVGCPPYNYIPHDTSETSDEDATTTINELLTPNVIQAVKVNNFLVFNGDNDGTINFERYEQWGDNNDIHVACKTNNLCIGIFWGGLSETFWDLPQNLMVNPRLVEGTDCYVRSGSYSTYFTSYVNEVRAEMEECVNTCIQDTGEKCLLFLSGISTGGQTAMVAGLDLRHLNPTILSIGGLKNVFEYTWWHPYARTRCSGFDNLVVIRFTFLQLATVCDGVFYETHYDDYVFDWSFGATNFGHHVIVDTDGLAVYVGNPSREDRYPASAKFHWGYHLTDWLNAFSIYPCNYTAYTTNGWPNGHWCSMDDECISGNCRNNECGAKLQRGEMCKSDSECSSRHCVTIGNNRLGFMWPVTSQCN